MATVSALAGGALPNNAVLSTAQAGNGASSNVVDRGNSGGPALLKIVTTVGATPTCTYAIEASADGTTWFAAAYSDLATPETLSVATFAITTATTTLKILRPNHPWRYLRVTYSANTNVTNTADVWVF